MKYLGLKLFIFDGKQSKAKEKEAFCRLTVFQNIPLLVEQRILAGSGADGEKWMNPGDTEKSSAKGGKIMDQRDWEWQRGSSRGQQNTNMMGLSSSRIPLGVKAPKAPWHWTGTSRVLLELFNLLGVKVSYLQALNVKGH